MSPTINQGCLLLIRRGTQACLGNVVIARHDGREVVKRVIDIDEDRVQLAGDNHAAGHSVGWVGRSEILGRVKKSF